MTWIPGRHEPWSNAASLLVCGLLAGVVVAAAAFPLAAISGLAAKAGVQTFDKLPGELTMQSSPQISYVYASDGKTLIATMYDENRHDVPLAQVSPLMKQAIVSAEDQNFYHHNGVDLRGLARAFVANSGAGHTEQGASTLTMQYVRQAISYSASTPQEVVDATEDTPSRKVREIKYALALEKKLDKDEILEKYLNIAPFGNGAYGVYAASQVYFNKPPANLKVEEAALLAGLVKAPSDLNPADPTKRPAAKDRRDWVLDQMVNTGAITQAQGDAAKQTPVTVAGSIAPNGCTATMTAKKWGFFCDYLYRWWLSQETFGATTYDRERRLKSGGYKIVTSIDLQAQADAQKEVNKVLPNDNPNALMVAAVEPATGRVRALAVNRNFKLDDPNKPENGISSNPAKKAKNIRGSYPNTTNPLITGGGDIDGYQAGSTFKAFTMVAALEKGYPLSYTINTQDQYRSNYIVEYNGPASCAGTNKYCPKNASTSMKGPRNMWTGFGRSVNTYFVPLEETVGADKVVDAAKRLGIEFRSKGTADNPSDYERSTDADLARGWGAFTLGVSATTPLDLANAYATLAADGLHCEPIPVQEIHDFNGSTLDAGNPRCQQVVDKDVARAAIDAGRCPVGDRSTYGSKCDGATAGGVHSAVDRPVSGKTGTVEANWTASMVVTTRQLAVASILADPEWAQTTKLSYSGKNVHTEMVDPAAYRTLADYMKTRPALEFAKPSEKLVYGDQRSIPGGLTCQSVDEVKSKLTDAGFTPSVNDSPIDSSCPAGSVARTDPDGKTIRGGLVMIYLSNGKGSVSASASASPSTPPRTNSSPSLPPPRR